MIWTRRVGEVNEMAKYIIKNALMVIPTMLAVVFIIFTINHFTPGDPVAIFYDFDYTEEQYAEKAAEWGLDQPFLIQFVNYVKNIVTKFDFGYSYYSGNSVMSELSTRFPVSLQLGLISVLLTVLRHRIGDTAVFHAGLWGDLCLPVFCRCSGLLAVHDYDPDLLQPLGLAALVWTDELDLLHHAGDCQLRAVYRLSDQADPLQHAGGHTPGLYPHGPGEGGQ